MSRGFRITILLILAIVLLGIYLLPNIVPAANRPSPILPAKKSPSTGANYIPGEVALSFKNGVTETEATTLLNKYNLRPKNPESFFRFIYVTLHTSDGNIDGHAQSIRTLGLPNIRQVNVFGKERTGVTPWITVDFDPPASKADIDRVLEVSSSLSVENGMFGPESVYAIAVPTGKEEYFVGVFLKEPIVKAAFLNYVGHINTQGVN